MLNLAREDVYQYLLDCYSDLLKNNTIKFIKWDYNRGLSDPGWPNVDAATQKEVRIRYFYISNAWCKNWKTVFLMSGLNAARGAADAYPMAPSPILINSGPVIIPIRLTACLFRTVSPRLPSQYDGQLGNQEDWRKTNPLCNSASCLPCAVCLALALI